MSGANQQQNRPLVRDEFMSLLETEWTRPVTCQDECPPGSCSCQRNIVHVHALEAWWNKQASDNPEYTKLKRFVDEMPVPSHLSLPVKPTKVSGGGQSCLRILSLLLKQGRDHLIDRFYGANMYDAFIERSHSDQNLREQLAGVVRHEDVETIIDDFHKEKWEYCPLSLTLDMERNLHGTRVIPPFCSKIKLPDKGGTASIYWVAVQKDLVSDNALASALKDSLYTDSTYGECYQMVLKSYCGNKKRDFELEKEAFSRLEPNDQAPILQYLGSYIHDYGEGKGLGKTYNLLLEYGENDLYQAWADETNVPPVQAHEILQSWKSLFKVAGAIRHLHNLEIVRGKGRPWRFHGWHADIKPDNILSVRGRLKLADFGFSSFAPVPEGHDGSEPTELIRGYTKTYGAPEVSRMKQPDGTLSGVSQSIDAWSFGCVLSVAATWIVLGFQGLRQYERLRQLSPANRRNKPVLDRFHDGTDVLPEVGKWHNYLRGHLRPSDTTTDLVLDLIENRLLRADPAARYNLEELCEKLREVSGWAEHKIKDLKKNSKEPDPLVMKALSNIEEEAQIQKYSEPKVNLLQQPLLQANPRERASMQINKEEMIRNKPLGQTAHRKQILEKKLEDCYGMKANDDALAGDVHNGAVTHSPIESTPPTELDFPGRKTKPRNPQLQELDQTQSDVNHHTPNRAPHHLNFALPATPPPSNRQPKVASASASATVYSDGPFTPNSHAPSVDVGPRTSPNSGRPSPQISIPDSPLTKYSIRPAPSNGIYKSSILSDEEEAATQNVNLSPSSLPIAEKTTYRQRSPPHTPKQSTVEHDVGDQSLPLAIDAMDRQSFGGKVSVVPDTSPIGSPFDDKRVYQPTVGASTPIEHITNAGLSITVCRPEDAQSQQDRPAILSASVHHHEKQAVESEHIPQTYTSSRFNDPFLLPLPSTVLSLNYDICVRRKDLDEQTSKGFAKGLAKVRGSFGIETRARDASLADTFSDPRELIFVVDNGWTMSEHWPIATFVAQTLAKNAAGLDRSGFDLKFTVDGHRHDQVRLRGDSGRKKLKKALRAAWPEYKANDHTTTNMARVFEQIFQEWIRSGRPATTLLVLTDGVWSNTDLNALNKTILDIAERDQLHAGNRHFSIQFIRFGDEETERIRLQWLDDGLCVGNNLRDIIDHCSWRAKVDKMFKGSIEGYLDEQDSDEEPILYDYKKLVDLFDTFNKGEDATLSPTGTLFRSTSRLSNRSSASMSNSGDWTGRH